MGKYDGCIHKMMAKSCIQKKSKMFWIQFVDILLLLVFCNKINKLYEDLRAIGRQILKCLNNKLHKLLLF